MKSTPPAMEEATVEANAQSTAEAAQVASSVWTRAGARPASRADVVRKPPPMLFGAIDVGTNSIHLVMAEISREGDFGIVGREKEMVQLGKGSFGRHVLTDRAMIDALAALQRFEKMARLKGVSRLVAVATSAVREARNGGDFVERVRNEVGLDLKIVSAEEEARLIYLAARHSIDLGESDNLILDIGGGSIEMIVGNATRPELLWSAKLGGSRLAELFVRHDPVDADDLKRLQHHIDNELKPIAERIGPRKMARCIGTSGSIETLTAMFTRRRDLGASDPAARQGFTRAELKALWAEMAEMTRAQRLKIPGLVAQRVDSIVPATVLILSVLRTFDVAEVAYCDMALREGVIIDYIGSHRAYLTARATWPDPRTRSVQRLAERCNASLTHAEQVARLAVDLFDQLQSWHGLEPEQRDLLRYAAFLHDVGYLISHRGHHKHSYYLIRNGGLAGFTERQIEIIANVARYHRKSRPRKADFSYGNLDKVDRPAVRKLVALLRLADALDRTHFSVVEKLACRVLPDRVEVAVQASKDAELELWTARRQGAFFEREFGRPVEVRLGDPEIKEAARADG